jgi:hypothetical protein
VDDDMILDLGSDNMTEDGDLIIRLRAHPITQMLLDYKEPLRIGARAASGRCPGAPAAPA